MKSLKLAWRNLFRQKRRTLITLSALIFGLAGLVVFQGYISQTMVGYRDNTIRDGLGHLQVAASPKYFTEGEFNPFSFEMPTATSLMDQFTSRAEVISAFPSTGFTAVASTGEKSTTLLIKAFPWEFMEFEPPQGKIYSKDPRSFHLGRLNSGEGISQETSDGIVLGATAAKILKVQVGDVITLMALLPEGGLNGMDFSVTGIYQSSGRDKLFAFVDFATAQGFLGRSFPPVVHVLLENPLDASKLEALPGTGYTVKTWETLAAYYVQVNSMFMGFLNVIRFILLLITLFILANNMNRIVLERMKEWGTLRTVGTKKRALVTLVVLEGLLLGLAGGVLGTVIGWIFSWILNLFGGLPFHDGGEIFQIRILIDPLQGWLNLLPVVLTAGLASLLPGFKVICMTPSECLRQQ